MNSSGDTLKNRANSLSLENHQSRRSVPKYDCAVPSYALVLADNFRRHTRNDAGALGQRLIHDFSLPRFELETRVDARSALQDLGMTEAFARREADFSGAIEASKTFSLASVHTVTAIAVDELGLFAKSSSSAMTPNEMTELDAVRVDRPFVFIVYKASTDFVLFVGRVSAPR